MKKTFFRVLLIGCVMMLGAKVYAQDSNDNHQMMQMPMDAQKQTDTVTSEKATNVGNAICPVTGEKIDEETKATYEYKGKIYNFCCAMCIEEFKNDPEKYIKKVEEELQAKKVSPRLMRKEPQIPIDDVV